MHEDQFAPPHKSQLLKFQEFCKPLLKHSFLKKYANLQLDKLNFKQEQIVKTHYFLIILPHCIILYDLEATSMYIHSANVIQW